VTVAVFVHNDMPNIYIGRRSDCGIRSTVCRGYMHGQAVSPGIRRSCKLEGYAGERSICVSRLVDHQVENATVRNTRYDQTSVQKEM